MRRGTYGGNILLSLVMGCLPFFQSQLMADDNAYSFNNFGGIGLLDMRTARFAPDGTIAVGVHHNSRETRYFSTWQATPWLETTLSYTDDTADRLGIDRSLDVKLRLWTEGDYRPQLAIGVQDALGTGNFGAEYIVASKRYYDFDFTMGFAWGYLGSRGSSGNIFKLFGDRFDERAGTISSGGIRTGSFFSGDDMSFFAGVEYHPKIKGLSFKVEYSGVDTTKIAAFSHLKRKAAFNVGVNYKPTAWADVALGFGQGEYFGIRLTLKQGLHKVRLRKWLKQPDPAPIMVRGESENRGSAPSNKTTKSAYDKMVRAKLSPVAISIDKQTVTVRKESGPFFSEVKNIGRAARILTGEMPDNVEELVVITEKNGTKISWVSILRQDLEKANNYQSSPEEIWANSMLSPYQSEQTVQNTDKDIYQPQSGLQLDWGFKPYLLTHFGGNDDGRFRADLYAKLYGSVQVNQKLMLSAELKQYIVGDIDKIPLDLRPNIPKVRSDISRYAREGRTSLERVQLDYTSHIGPDLYARFTAGFLDSMYGGFGAEILYRPYHNDFALGLDVNWVKQRDFDQLFSFRDYEVFTGHATFYHENVKFGISSKLSVGRYLAGDYGATLDVSRRFASGIRIGVWATVTSMSSNQFGDGSFDKGIYLTMPLEMLWHRPTQQKMRFNFRSLGKNGGQKLERGYDLYDIFLPGRMNMLAEDWHELLN